MFLSFVANGHFVYFVCTLLCLPLGATNTFFSHLPIKYIYIYQEKGGTSSTKGANGVCNRNEVEEEEKAQPTIGASFYDLQVTIGCQWVDYRAPNDGTLAPGGE